MNLYEKLTALQNELAVPKGRKNAFGKYNYRSAEDILEAVKPLLKKHRLTQHITDTIKCIGERYYVESIVTVTDMDKPEDSVTTTGQAREEDEKKGMDSAQVTGSTSSYARKYALNGMYAIDESEADNDSLNNGTAQGDKLMNKANLATASELETLYALAKKKGFERDKVGEHIKTKFRKLSIEIDKEQLAIMMKGYGAMKDLFEGTPFGEGE